MQSENDVILTARPRGRGTLGAVSVGCDGVRVCGGELCSRYHVYEKPLGFECRRGNAVRVVRSSSDAKERHRRPWARKISAVCSLFLADQLPVRYFWQIRDRGTIVL